jgi:hypothetical protein
MCIIGRESQYGCSQYGCVENHVLLNFQQSFFTCTKDGEFFSVFESCICDCVTRMALGVVCDKSNLLQI